MAIFQLGERIPQVDASAFVAESAAVIGSVEIGAGCNIWSHVTLRGDNEPIRLGSGTNVQESSVLHTDPGCPLTLGDNVTVGHQAMLHGCTVGDGSLIGIQAVVLNHVKIGRNCLVGAGSLLTEGKEFPEGSLILGTPAKVVRPLTAEEIEHLSLVANNYVLRGQYYKTHLKKIRD